MEPIIIPNPKYSDETLHKTLSDVGVKPLGRTMRQMHCIEMSYSRRMYQHVCPVCGQSFDGIKTAVTCSSACRKQRQRLASR